MGCGNGTCKIGRPGTDTGSAALYQGYVCPTSIKVELLGCCTRF